MDIYAYILLNISIIKILSMINICKDFKHSPSKEAMNNEDYRLYK